MNAGALVPEARLVHQAPGRLRVVVPGMRGDAAYFDAVATALRRLPEVHAVRGNPLSASLLVLHRELDPQGLARHAAQEHLFTLHVEELSLPGTADDLREALDTGIRRLTGNQSNLQEAGAGALLALALVQVLRGQILVPATTFFFLALATLDRAERPPPEQIVS